ncbi:MAG TPA: hypothetical protein VGH03_01075 [Caulobacteraceae bacterium]|jgi:hypothetical protein
MSRTITRLFDNFADAERAVAELERMGVPHRDISLIAGNADKSHDHRGPYDDGRTPGDHAARDAGKGAATGGAIGGVGGLLAGLGLLAIPGLGPVVAAGWLASTLVGAGVGAAAGGAAGGLIGALKHAGESDENAQVYAEGVRRGGTLVSAKVDDSQAAKVESALIGFHAVDAATRGAAYRQSGWSRFDDTAPVYTVEQIEVERSRYTAP